MEQEQLKEEEMAKKSKKENTPKNKQQQEGEEATDNKKSKIGKKSRAGTAGIPAKTPTESITGTAPPVADQAELHPTEEPFKVKLKLLSEHIDTFTSAHT